MSRNNLIKSILDLYFGKQFSRYGRILFGRWLKSESDSLQKWEAVHDLWLDTNAVPTEETRRDWEELRGRLPMERTRKRKELSWYRISLKYAAVILLMLLTAATTYLLTSRRTAMDVPEMTCLSVPYGEREQVALPDGSVAWVDAGSSLIYPKDFSRVKNRTIYLSGKASFSVTKNPEQPFIVKTSFIDVQALGTVFTVEAYSEDSLTTATLEEGSILVSASRQTFAPTILQPNQQLVYSHKAHSMVVQDIDASLYNKEKEGYLIFEHASFDRLMSVLERRFNVSIEYNSQKYGNDHYNVKFSPDETLEGVLGVLHELIGIRYTIRKGRVFIN